MFFILSKVLLFLIKPVNWLAALLLYAFFGKNERWKWRSMVAALILFFSFSNHFIFNQVVKCWEPAPYSMKEMDQAYDIGILLGGYSNFSIYPNDERHHFNERANRLTTTLELYYRGKIKKILLSGGTGRLLADEPSEAVRVKGFLLDLNIPEEDIILEPNSRNTRENAVFTTAIIQEKFPEAHCLLITSAWHMPRAAACFRKTGLDFKPFCVDYLGEYTRLDPQSVLLPYATGLSRWEMLIKEWVGYVAYWMQGYV